MPSITKITEYEESHASFNTKVQKPAQQTGVLIPASAIPINVTSVKNPYIMRAYIVKEYEMAIEKIVRKLWEFVKTDESYNKDNDADLKIGDMVIVHCENYRSIVELPSFICRGSIINIRKETGFYYVLLVDYGICVELIRDDLVLVSHNFLPEKYLTKCVGAFNILPLCQKSNSSNATVVEHWTEEAIEYTRDLFASAKITYFDRILCDENNEIEYGEFYLIIEDVTVCLSDILEMKHYAIRSERLRKALRSSNCKHNEESEAERVVHVKLSYKRNNTIQPCNSSSKNSVTRIFHSDKVLIHSHVFCGVFDDVSYLGYPHEVHENWKEVFKSTRPMKLQKHIWPAINKKLNVVGVGPPRCGKTTGCAMAACGLVTLHRHESYKVTQPLILFLCSSSADVITVQSICSSLLSSTDGVKSVAAFNERTHRSIVATIYGGCQILVSTPRYLVHFLDTNKGLLSFDKLFCLILDNADIILKKYYNSMAELFKKYNIIKNRELRGDNAPILQIIVSATRWTPEIHTFVRFAMYKPYICITSLLEAVTFKQRIVCSQLYKVESRFKTSLVSDLLKNDYKSIKTMIVCVNAKEAEELNTHLVSLKETILIHEQMTFSDRQVSRENWIASVRDFYPVLICTDAVLSELNFTDIHWLIHYSLPSQTKTPFSYRFSVLLNILSQNTTKCKVTIIIDEYVRKPLPSIIRMMQQMNGEIPPNLLEDSEKIQLTLEREKKEYDICDRMKSFGFCEGFSLHNTCTFRHCVFPEIDVSPLQKADIIKFVITHFHDATHFSARLLEHIPHSHTSKAITFSSEEYLNIPTTIQTYFQNVENRKMCTSTNVGDICVLELPIGIFNRVKIRNVRRDGDISNNIKFVDVRYVDSGAIHERVEAIKLLHIPEELRDLPTHIREIYLAGVKPRDEEYVWNREANKFVSSWYSEFFTGNCYVIGKVCLSIGNTLWLENLHIGTKIKRHPDLLLSSLKRKLVDGNYAVLNEEHVPNLTKLWENGFIVNGYSELTSCK